MLDEPVDSEQNAKPIELTLLSRRRSAMGGVRMICRGIDDESNCGNFVETEMILTSD